MTSARRENIPSVPDSLEDLHETLEEYDQLAKHYRGRTFGEDGSEVLLFIHEYMMGALAKCTQIFCDGTFKVRSKK